VGSIEVDVFLVHSGEGGEEGSCSY
jgi:hypothetical protein